MESVSRLIREHDLIERALNLLETAVTKLRQGSELPEGFAQWAPRFFQTFADLCHHAKEEDVFFPVLKLRGIPEQGGPIGVMLHEHTLGRDCVQRMLAAHAASPFDREGYSTAAGQFIPLLRQHIYKENQILFQMAQHVMSAADDEEVARKFTEVEQARELADLYDRFLAEVEAWERQLPSGA